MYYRNMPVRGNLNTQNVDGEDQDTYTVTFTNGALKELEQLKDSMKAPDLDSVLQIAIGVLKRFQQVSNEREQSDKAS